MNTINYSFIIPHKNIPELLQRCLNSIPYRRDIQIIIVDDNSDESIVDFKNFPGMDRDEAEVYFTKKGGGAGYARNIGLNYARGKWLLFADADDYFTPELFSICDSYLNSNYDMIVFDTCSTFSDSLKRTEKREDVIDLFQIQRDENILRYLLHTVWGKIFRREFVERMKIRFEEVPASNDVLFSGLAGLYAKNIYFDKRIGYCCTVRNGSICNWPKSSWLKYHTKYCIERDRYFVL